MNRKVKQVILLLGKACLAAISLLCLCYQWMTYRPKASQDCKYESSFDPSEPESFRRDVPKAEIHIVDGGHFALDTAADEIAFIIREFMK